MVATFSNQVRVVLRVLAAKGLRRSPAHATVLVTCGGESRGTSSAIVSENEARWQSQQNEFIFLLQEEELDDPILLSLQEDSQDLGHISLSLRTILAEGKAMPRRQAVHSAARWYRIGASQILISSLIFLLDKSTKGFEAALARILYTQEKELALPQETISAVERLRRTAKCAERSLLGDTSGLRDRIRDQLARLRNRDTQADAAGILWAELRDLSTNVIFFLDEMLAIKKKGGPSTAVLTDEAAPLAARKHVLQLIAAIVTIHPKVCASRLFDIMRTLGHVSQSLNKGGAGTALAEECATTAGTVAFYAFPHAISNQKFRDDEAALELLLMPFQAILSRPSARGRRAVAACAAKALSAAPGRGLLWLHCTRNEVSSKASLDHLRRHLGECDISLPSTLVTLPNGTGVVLIVPNLDTARHLAQNLSNILPYGWNISKTSTRNDDQIEELTFIVAIAPNAAVLANWILETCKSNIDALEPFFRAALALLQLLTKTNKIQHKTATSAAHLLSEALAVAAPTLARHAIRCLENNKATWRDRLAALDLIEAIAKVDCCKSALNILFKPVYAATQRAKTDTIAAIRHAAQSALLALSALKISSVQERQPSDQSRSLLNLLGSRISSCHPAPHSTLSSRIAPAIEAPAPAQRLLSPTDTMSAFLEDVPPAKLIPQSSSLRQPTVIKNAQPPWRARSSRNSQIVSETESIATTLNDDDSRPFKEVRRLRSRVDKLTARCDNVLEEEVPFTEVTKYEEQASFGDIRQQAARHLQRNDFDTAFNLALTAPSQINVLWQLLNMSSPETVLPRLEKVRLSLLIKLATELISGSQAASDDLLRWLTADTDATIKALEAASDKELHEHVYSCVRILAAEPCERGVRASALLHALDNNS